MKVLFFFFTSLNTVLMFAGKQWGEAVFFFLEENLKDRKKYKLNQIRKGNFTEYFHCSLKTGRAQICKEVKPNHTNHMHRALPIMPECRLLSLLRPLQSSFLTSVLKPDIMVLFCL